MSGWNGGGRGEGGKRRTFDLAEDFCNEEEEEVFSSKEHVINPIIRMQKDAAGPISGSCGRETKFHPIACLAS